MECMTVNAKHKLNIALKPLMEINTIPEDGIYNFTLMNMGTDSAIREQVIFDVECPFSKDTEVYGEGVSMLSQYKGTVEKMECIGSLDDKQHYRIWSSKEWNQVYNMAVFHEKTGRYTLIGFSSCNHFVGGIRFSRERIQVVLHMEGKVIACGEKKDLEQLFIMRGNNRSSLLKEYAAAIVQNHPRLPIKEQPTGWCSWYCYGPNVTEKDVLNNMDSIKRHKLNLKYIQIDDGYEKYMGDWLSTADTFPIGIKSLCETIHRQGFEPAIWIAPFIAEEKSMVLQQHPQWFVQSQDNKPLSSGNFTFPGWRCAPWYMLDPTHPDAYDYIRDIFRTMRNEWNCRYFKLDANMWGCFTEGVRYDRKATSVESYRLGMKAILEGVGEDGIILGCNAPIWPSLGVVHANRLTGDVCRDVSVFKQIAMEGFYRNWQNRRLWVNDPDCVTVERNFVDVMDFAGNSVIQKSNLREEEFEFHATYIYATGGMVLSGDDLSQPNLERLDILRYLLQNPHPEAEFDSTAFEVGRIKKKDGWVICIFNWQEQGKEMEVKLDRSYRQYDVWKKEYIGQDNRIKIYMPPVSGKLIICDNV